jgi:hypothetical protein
LTFGAIVKTSSRCFAERSLNASSDTILRLAAVFCADIVRKLAVTIISSRISSAKIGWAEIRLENNTKKGINLILREMFIARASVTKS